MLKRSLMRCSVASRQLQLLQHGSKLLRERFLWCRWLSNSSPIRKLSISTRKRKLQWSAILWWFYAVTRMLHRLLMPALYTVNMSEKKAILLRIDIRKLRAIEKWASDEFRSTSAQIEFILDEALRKAGRYKGSKEAGQEGEE